MWSKEHRPQIEGGVHVGSGEFKVDMNSAKEKLTVDVKKMYAHRANLIWKHLVWSASKWPLFIFLVSQSMIFAKEFISRKFALSSSDSWAVALFCAFFCIPACIFVGVTVGEWLSDRYMDIKRDWHSRDYSNSILDKHIRS